MSDKTPTKVLTFLEAVRKRPGMFFGNLDARAINQVIYEAVANAVDQFLAGAATTVNVQVQGHEISVSDDGGGLPFHNGATEAACEHLAEQYFLHHHDAPTADNHAPHIHLIGGGLGLAALNAVCDHMVVTSYNTQQRYTQTFSQGKVVKPSVIDANSNKQRGTRLQFTVDEQVFGFRQPNLLALRKTLFELAHFYPGLVVAFQNERFCAKQGLLDLAYIQYTKPSAAWALDPPRHYFFETTQDNIQLQVAAVGDIHLEDEAEQVETTFYKTWVNGGETVEGGTHQDGLHKAFENARWQPRLALLHVIMHEPKFAGPSRDALRNKRVASLVERVVSDSLRDYLKQN